MLPIYSRGITIDNKKRAQQNTIDAISYVLDYQPVGKVGEEKKDKEYPTIETETKWVEIHAMVIKDKKTVAVVHDENLKELTGIDVGIKNLDKKQIQDLNILKNVDGIEYDKERKIAFLDDVFEMIPKYPLNFWISVKNKKYQCPNKQFETARILMEYLRKKSEEFYSKYSIVLGNRIVLSSTHPLITWKMVKLNTEFELSRTEYKYVAINALNHILPVGASKIYSKFNISFDYFNICGCINHFVKKFFLRRMYLEKKYGLNYVLIEKENITQEIIDKYRDNKIEVGIYSVGDNVMWKNVNYNMISK